MKSSLRPGVRALTVVFSLVALALSACGGGEQTPTPTPTPTLPAAPSNNDWPQVRASGKLIVGTAGDYQPFEYYDQNYQLDGFDIALMKDVGRRLGVQVAFNDFAFDGVLAALQLGQVDAAIAALSVTPERQQSNDFTNIYYVGGDGFMAAINSSIAAIRSVQDLVGKRIGAQQGSVYATFLQQSLVDTGLTPASNIFLYTDTNQGASDLTNGRIDVMMLDVAPAREFVNKGGFKLVGEGLNNQLYAIAVRKGSSLLPELNRALANAQADGTVTRLVQQYLKLTPPQILPTPTPGVIATIVPNPPPPPCLNGMSWVQDLTYDDKNMTAPPVLNPGQSFVKAWRVRNSGTCTWTTQYTFAYAGGNSPLAQMGGQTQRIAQPVAPGAIVDFQVPLVAPSVPGTYQGFWQMRDASGTPFGQKVWVGITVASPTPFPTQTPTTDIIFTASQTQIQSGQPVVFSWQVTNASAVYFYAEGVPQAQRSGVPFVGQTTVYPPVSTMYNLQVVKPDGSSEVRQIYITVTASPGAPVIAQFSMNPSNGQIAAGQCIVLNWVVQGSVNQVQLTRNGAMLWNGAPITGSYTDCPPGSGSIVYNLNASGPAGTTSAQQVATVSGGGGAPVITSFSVSPDSVASGGCVTVSWSTSGATDVVVTRNNSLRISSELNGSTVDCLSVNPGYYIYTIVARNSAGQTATQERGVTVFVVQATPAP